ncbi:tetratricopeptide repeat protein [Chryseobacterium phosphatilyticum]|nr:hypothetical protein [Chryseobacterium phosphatilyticum]
MLDGSRDLSPTSSRFLVWKINGNKICEYSNPWAIETKECTNFKYDKNLIVLSDRLAFQIESLTPDSLIVMQKVDGITFPDKIRKMWFVKTSTLVKNFTDKTTGDSIIINSRNVTPILKKEIISEMMEAYMNKGYTHDINMNGKILIFPKKQEIEVITDFKKQSKDNQAGIDLFKKNLEKNYKMWDITGFEKFEKIIIPYHFSSKTVEGSGSLGFSNKVSDGVDQGIVINIKNKNTSLENFNKGVEAANKKKFDNAIYYFNKAHEDDNTNTDALYNVVSISLALKNVNEACSALKKLNDLEQVNGIKLYKEKCEGN